MSEDWRPTARWQVLALRAAMLAELRAFFAARGVVEVETPCLSHAGVTDVHLESLRVTREDGAPLGHLHTSPEYAMKRLLAAGAPDIYQVAHVFRGAESGRRHNPEFTMLEWYRHGFDHHALIDEVEALLRYLIGPRRSIGQTTRLAYYDAVSHALGIDAGDADATALAGALRQRGVDVPGSVQHERDAVLDLAMSLAVAPQFARDSITFVYDFPASQAALAQLRGPVASRFEAYWGELELVNGFHELGASDEQERRFEADNAERLRRGLPTLHPDRRFLDALAAGLPPCAGVALGFDRVVMLAAGATHIDEVIAFPFDRA